MLATTVASVAVLVALASPALAGWSFASIGDWGCVPIGGWHAQDEYIIAQQFMTATQQISARFILNPGDNFYYCGVHNKTDAMWNSTFESVFTSQSTMVPWYSAVGNHDYGYPGSVTAQIEYQSPNNNRWVMPDRYYYQRLTFPETNISLVVLDASPCQHPYVANDPSGWDPCGSVIPGCPGCTFHQNVVAQSCQKQATWLQNLVPTLPADDWKIVMIHAPAPDIDEVDLTAIIQQAGFDLYLNGHVHLMAHYTIDGAGTYITSGGGCMVRVPQDELAKKLKEPQPKLGETSCPHNTRYKHSCELVYQQTIGGYTTHTFSDDYKTLSTFLYDYAGNLLHTAVVNKGSGPGPSPTNPPSASNSGSGSSSCCYYSDTSCRAGETCCNEHGSSYGQWACQGADGQKHNCVWSDGTCVVGGGSSSGGADVKPKH
jgi:hypothetical protein